MNKILNFLEGKQGFINKFVNFIILFGILNFIYYGALSEYIEQNIEEQ